MRHPPIASPNAGEGSGRSGCGRRVQTREIGDALAIDVVRASRPDLLAGLAQFPALTAAIARVGARHDEPEPEAMRTPAEMRVEPAAWERLNALLDHPLEST